MATDQEHKIMHMFYDWDEERKVMLNMQKCQRNWDYAKWEKIKPELRKHTNPYAKSIAGNASGTLRERLFVQITFYKNRNRSEPERTEPKPNRTEPEPS